MRPKSNLIFLVILSAALCEIAELRLTEPFPQPQQKTQDHSSLNIAPHIFNLTFEEFKQKYQKHYSSISQENYRKLIFQRNLDQLNLHNSNPDKKYSKKPNAFLDVNQDEFKSVFTTIRPPDNHSRNVSEQMRKKGQCKIKQKDKHLKNQSYTSKKNKSSEETQFLQIGSSSVTEDTFKTEDNSYSETHLPNKAKRNLQSQSNLLDQNSQEFNLAYKSDNKMQTTSVSSDLRPSKQASKKNILIDWSAYSGPVRYQGYCGACYALATVDAFAAHLAIYYYNFFVGLSVQQIIDCTTNRLTFGCNGGYLEGSLTYIQMHGIVTQRVYPYTSGNHGAANSCKMSGGSFKLTSFHPLQEGSCSSVITQLYKGPVSAGISGYNLRFYDQGIFDDCSTKDPLDHAIMIIGYESGKGWRIKNSWGSDWGDNGYGWIAEENTCWICNMTMAIVI